jgi:HSP20 family molecular chaperone IbpA
LSHREVGIAFGCKEAGDMNMKKSIKNLLTSVDVLNTLHGGTSEPQLSFVEKSEGQQMRIRVPGLEMESLQVEIHNNELSIFYHIAIKSDGKVIQMPQVVYDKPIPYFISTEGITATFEQRHLVVDLPFNEKASGYHRKVEKR